jgi:hypothetical protein
MIQPTKKHVRVFSAHPKNGVFHMVENKKNDLTSNKYQIFW